MARARGANATMAVALETEEGLTPGSGFVQTPFVSSNLGEEQGLVASDVLGFGRDPQQPGRDAIDNTGDIVVPMCARNLGLWLTLLFGAASTATGLAASGAITFTAQPVNNATISLGGQDFTFVTGSPTANQIKIGATLRETVANAVRALNASAVSGVAAATYRAEGKAGAVIRITHDALGTAGNSFALAASSSPASGAVVSGATLAGGSASGGYRHSWVGGATVLPSASIEIGNPEVPSYKMNSGAKANSFGVQLARAGNLNATIGLIAGAEAAAGASAAGTPTTHPMLKFSHFTGSVLRRKVPVGDLVSGQLNISNGMEAVPTIGTGDGRIGGVDEGMLAVTGQVGIRYSTRDFEAMAVSDEADEFEFSWSIPGAPWSLRFIVHEVRLPKAKAPITGPTGVQADYGWQASENAALGRTLTVELVNDVATY